MKSKVQKILSICLVLSIHNLLFSESFRVLQLKEAHLQEDVSQEISLTINYADAIGIYLPEVHDFIKAFEIEIKIPQELLPYRQSVGYALYKETFPKPSATNIDYKGTSSLSLPLPPKLSMVLQVPLLKNHGLQKTPYTTIANISPEYKSPMMFRLLPLAKGLPDNIEDLQFDVKIRPILEHKGKLNINIEFPKIEEESTSEEGGASQNSEEQTNVITEEQSFELAKIEEEEILIYIDEQFVDGRENIILTTGMHNLSVMSQNYRHEARSFSIDTAKTTTLDIVLKDTIPLIQFVAPENSKIWYDDVLLEDASLQTPLKTTPGTHTVKCAVGDYEITRTVTVEKGNSYTVSLLITLEVSNSR